MVIINPVGLIKIKISIRLRQELEPIVLDSFIRLEFPCKNYNKVKLQNYKTITRTSIIRQSAKNSWESLPPMSSVIIIETSRFILRCLS